MKKTQFDLHLSEHQLEVKKRNTDQAKPKQTVSVWKHVGFYSNIGFVIVIPLVVMTGAGIYIDQRFSTAPYGKYIGIALGFFFSISGFVKSINDFISEMKKNS